MNARQLAYARNLAGRCAGCGRPIFDASGDRVTRHTPGRSTYCGPACLTRKLGQVDWSYARRKAPRATRQTSP